MATESCQVCGNQRDNRLHCALEMMFGTRAEFSYLECGTCGCLQLQNPPVSIAEWYPPRYYSFQCVSAPSPMLTALKRRLRVIKNRVYLQPGAGAKIMRRVKPFPALEAFAAARPKRDSRILDVGCGAGNLLKDLADAGFHHALGIDPFLENDLRYDNGLEVYRRTVESLAGSQWDVVMFHHSLEHIGDPLGTLHMVWDLLAPEGLCIVRIPIASWSWNRYGVNWVELEPPRHLFLHTERSFRLLAERAGFAVRRVEYDSDGFELWGSELYRRGISLSSLGSRGPRQVFSAAQMHSFRKAATRLNRERRAGRAAFHLSKSQTQ